MVSMIPRKTITIPAAFWTYLPACFPFLIKAPLNPKYQRMIMKKITGTEVPTAKMPGNSTPYDVEKTRGMRVAKNNTNIVGQKANENPNPMKNEPIFPFNHLSGTLNNLTFQYILKRPNKYKPTRMRIGPTSLLNHGKYNVSVL